MTPEKQLKAVKKNGEFIEFIEKPTIEAQYEAATQDYNNIRYIKDTKELRKKYPELFL